MKSYWKAVNKVIRESDVLLLILDARFVEETRNEEIEQKVKSSGKPLIYVLTKCDLAEKRNMEVLKRTLVPSVFVSAKEHWGSIKLRDRIMIEAKRAYGDREDVWVGVLGYPNVGKSSLINLMRGRHSAPTSSLSGHTRGAQFIRADKRIMFVDTPGVIPYMEKDEVKHVFIGTVDYTKAADPDIAAIELMRRFPGKIGSYYGVPEGEDKESALEAIAIRKKVLQKGGIPDMMRMARIIIKDFQRGRIK